MKEVEENMARVWPRFERTRRHGTKELRASRCSRNLADRSVVTGHMDAYRLINLAASSFVHEMMSGMVRHFDAAKRVPPTLDWWPQALVGAHLCTVQVVTTLGEASDTASTPPLEEREKHCHYAWPEPDGLV